MRKQGTGHLLRERKGGKGGGCSEERCAIANEPIPSRGKKEGWVDTGSLDMPLSFVFPKSESHLRLSSLTKGREAKMGA